MADLRRKAEREAEEFNFCNSKVITNPQSLYIVRMPSLVMLLKTITSVAGILELEGYQTQEMEPSGIGVVERFRIIGHELTDLPQIEETITRHYTDEGYTRSEMSNKYRGKGFLSFSSKQGYLDVINITPNLNGEMRVSVVRD